jgi:hypothetical protein
VISRNSNNFEISTLGGEEKSAVYDLKGNLIWQKLGLLTYYEDGKCAYFYELLNSELKDSLSLKVYEMPTGKEIFSNSFRTSSRYINNNSYPDFYIVNNALIARIQSDPSKNEYSLIVAKNGTGQYKLLGFPAYPLTMSSIPANILESSNDAYLNPNTIISYEDKAFVIKGAIFGREEPTINKIFGFKCQE